MHLRLVIEQVFNGEDVLLRQPFGHTRAYALHEFDFGVEIEHFLDNTAGRLTTDDTDDTDREAISK